MVHSGGTTAEDDPHYPKEKKLVMLEDFHNKLYDRDFHIDDCTCTAPEGCAVAWLRDDSSMSRLCVCWGGGRR